MALDRSPAESDNQNQDLIRAALRGDDEAFEEVIRLFSRRLYAVAYGVVQNVAEAEDIVQESFLAAHRHRWRLRDPAKFPAWLSMIARNKARDVLRRRSRQGSLPVEEDSQPEMEDTNVPAPSAEIEQGERERTLRILLGSLPEQWRAAITLRYLEGMSYGEIETELGLSSGALRGILGRAMGRLRDGARHSLKEFRN